MVAKLTICCFPSFSCGCFSLFKAVEVANQDTLAILAVKSTPLLHVFSKRNAFFARSIIFLDRSISSIFSVSCDPQVTKPIVSSIPVDVIDVFPRIDAVDDRPDDSMGQKSTTIKRDKPIAISLRQLGKRAYFSVRSSHFARKTTDIWIVRKKPAQFFNWKRFWLCWHRKNVHENLLLSNLGAS